VAGEKLLLKGELLPPSRGGRRGTTPFSSGAQYDEPLPLATSFSLKLELEILIRGNNIPTSRDKSDFFFLSISLFKVKKKKRSLWWKIHKVMVFFLD
jgi:hypothetical protein